MFASKWGQIFKMNNSYLARKRPANLSLLNRQLGRGLPARAPTELEQIGSALTRECWAALRQGRIAPTEKKCHSLFLSDMWKSWQDLTATRSAKLQAVGVPSKLTLQDYLGGKLKVWAWTELLAELNVKSNWKWNYHFNNWSAWRLFGFVHVFG